MGLWVWTGEAGTTRYAVRHWSGDWDDPGLTYVARPFNDRPARIILEKVEKALEAEEAPKA